MYEIEDAAPATAEYRALRAAVGWGSPPPEACRAALDGSVFAVVARLAGEAVGMARMVGDRTMYLLIVDVAVHPGHRGAGLGRRMVERLVAWADEQGARSTLLAADSEVVPFYESLGFSVEASRLMRHAGG